MIFYNSGTRQGKRMLHSYRTECTSNKKNHAFYKQEIKISLTQDINGSLLYTRAVMFTPDVCII